MYMQIMYLKNYKLLYIRVLFFADSSKLQKRGCLKSETVFFFVFMAIC